MSHGRLSFCGWLTPCSALSNVYASRSSLGTGVREIAQRAARASQLLEQETKALMTWLQAKGCGVERSAAGAPRRPGHDQAPGGGRGAAAVDLLPHVPGDGGHGVSVERGGSSTPSRSPGTRRPRRRSSTTARRTRSPSTRSWRWHSWKRPARGSARFRPPCRRAVKTPREPFGRPSFRPEDLARRARPSRVRSEIRSRSTSANRAARVR